MRFTIPGPPFGKADSRHTMTGARYTDTATANWYALVGLYCRRAAGFNFAPFAAPVVTIVAIKTRPQRKPKGYPLEWTPGRCPCLATPDCDNVAKGVLDGCTRVGLWKDDQKVSGLIVFTWYAAVGEEPHTDVNVIDLAARPLPNPAANRRPDVDPVKA